MKPTSPLQHIIDPFVAGFGGEPVSALVPKQGSEPEQADYLFRNCGVIAELKALEDDTFGEAYCRKLGELTHDWMRRGLILIYGTTKIELSRLPPICQQEWRELVADPLQKKLVTKANRQLRQTAQLLKMPDAKGVLWVASDGNGDLRPADVWSLLGKILSKKNQDGSRQYSNIHGVIYFNPRMPVRLPGIPDAGMFWMSHARDGDPALLDFFGRLSEAWAEHLRSVAVAAGQRFSNVNVPSGVGTLRFYDSTPKLPRVTAAPKKP